MKIIDSIFSIPDVLKLHKGITVLEGNLFQMSIPTKSWIEILYDRSILLVISYNYCDH